MLKRPYITVGTAGFLMLVPLAITSTAAMVRRLGPKRWQLLHRLVYFCALAGVIHYYWLVKSDVREPLMYWRHPDAADAVPRADVAAKRDEEQAAAGGRERLRKPVLISRAEIP